MEKIILFLFVCTSIFAEKSIEINLSTQTLTARNGDTIDLQSSICSGRVGYQTPVGKFKILGKERMHISNRYPIVDKEANIRGGAKMPYMLRVTNTGVAIHAGEMVNYPDSHGCIRVPYGKAMQLFTWTDIGTKVKIIGQAPYKDSINQMRIALLKNKSTKKRKKKKNYTNTIKWVDDHLSYYDDL
jgi:hypothetical protein